jgi:hypothetical protein
MTHFGHPRLKRSAAQNIAAEPVPQAKIPAVIAKIISALSALGKALRRRDFLKIIAVQRGSVSVQSSIHSLVGAIPFRPAERFDTLDEYFVTG